MAVETVRYGRLVFVEDPNRGEAMSLPARNGTSSPGALIGTNLGAGIGCILVVLAVFLGIYIVIFGWFFAMVLGMSKAANRRNRRGMW